MDGTGTSRPRIWTIGHSTLPATQFLALLKASDIESLADVRRFPSSRRHPQFNLEPLAASLAAAQISYQHFPELGGRRDPLPDSVNTGWREDGFRGYADYMQTAEFAAGISRLLAAAALILWHQRNRDEPPVGGTAKAGDGKDTGHLTIGFQGAKGSSILPICALV